MLGREVVEGEEGYPILREAGRGPIVLRAGLAREAVEGGFGCGAALRLVDGVQILLGLAVDGFRQGVEELGGLVNPAPSSRKRCGCPVAVQLDAGLKAQGMRSSMRPDAWQRRLVWFEAQPEPEPERRVFIDETGASTKPRGGDRAVEHVERCEEGGRAMALDQPGNAGEHGDQSRQLHHAVRHHPIILPDVPKRSIRWLFISIGLL
jgi:hypothetical protein